MINIQYIRCSRNNLINLTTQGVSYMIYKNGKKIQSMWDTQEFEVIPSAE